MASPEPRSTEVRVLVTGRLLLRCSRSTLDAAGKGPPAIELGPGVQ